MSDDLSETILSMDKKIDSVVKVLNDHGISLARLEEKVSARDKACNDKHSSLENRVKLWVITGVAVVLLAICGFFISPYFKGAKTSEREIKTNHPQQEISRTGDSNYSVLSDQ